MTTVMHHTAEEWIMTLVGFFVILFGICGIYGFNPSDLLAILIYLPSTVVAVVMVCVVGIAIDGTR